MNNKKENIYAILGFTLSFVNNIAGLILSIIGLSKAKEYESGKGLSIAGIIISIVKMVVSFIIGVLFVLILIFADDEYMDYSYPILNESNPITYNEYESLELIETTKVDLKESCISENLNFSFEIIDKKLYMIDNLSQEKYEISSIERPQYVGTFESESNKCEEITYIVLTHTGKVYYISLGKISKLTNIADVVKSFYRLDSRVIIDEIGIATIKNDQFENYVLYTLSNSYHVTLYENYNSTNGVCFDYYERINNY